MTLTLEQYDHQVGHHLRMIRHHAASIKTHVHYMTHQPDFETLAEGALSDVVTTLEAALQNASAALSQFREKPHDT